RLVRIAMFRRTGGAGKEFETLYDSLFEEDTRFCERETLDQDSYWPLRLQEILGELQDELCNEEKQSFLSS
ncbi:MAG: hypothetical protein KDD60_08790, partial [Bdellovibrionales bacterium]|nr:hypothetical protein [Bdellovibrionales bacterium]